MAPENWLKEQAPAPEPGPARFQSQEEDSEEDTVEAEEPVFFSSTAAVEDPFPEPEPELVAAAASRSRFNELNEDPVYTPLPRDYASDFGSGLRGPAMRPPEQNGVQDAVSLFPETDEQTQRDLDVPAFMRRSPF
jgi:hypothetical protein